MLMNSLKHMFKAPFASLAIVAVTTTQGLFGGCQTGCCWDYAVNPPLVYADCCECNWSGSLDYLYWKTFEDDLDFGSIVSRDDQFEQHRRRTYTFTRKDVNFDWDSGFRIALGYSFPCDCWALSLDWTHYRTDAHRNINVASSNTTNDIFINPPFVESIDYYQAFGNDITTSQMSASWTLQFNQVDLSFARNYQVGPCVFVKPHIDISALIIQQKMSNNLTVQDPTREVIDSSQIKCEFKGVGIGTGFDSLYQLGCGLGFYGTWRVSCYYGSFDQLHYLLEVDNFSERNTAVYDLQDRLTALRVVNNLSLGLSWITRYNCDRNIFYFKAGWEHHTYFGQNMFLNIERSEQFFTLNPIVDARGLGGNLYLYGFMFSVGLAF